MRIGIDCRTIGDGREAAGVGEYTLFLIQELLRRDGENAYVLFCDQHTRLPFAEREKVKIVTLPLRTIPFVSTHVATARAIARRQLDVFHATDGHVPYFYNGRTVITIHDLAILRHPEWFPESALERFISTHVLLRRAIARAQCIIVPSTSTAKDLKQFYGVADTRVRVIPLAPALPKGSRPPANIPVGPYLLFVGTIEPRKNLLRLLYAFQKIEDRNIRLVIAGKEGWKHREIMSAIKKTERVDYLGYVSEEEKRWLMEHALAFVFPSLYEGFGLPVIEAMSVGTPVITSDISALSEVTGNAALVVHPEDEDRLRRALNCVVADESLRSDYTTRGRVCASQFSWSRTAEETLNTYHHAVSR